MYTLKRINKTLSLQKNEQHYLIGFTSPSVARHVQYTIHAEPKMVLIANGYSQDNLIINKNTHGYYENDLYLNEICRDEFRKYPYTKMLGIIYADEIIDEDDDYIVFNCSHIKPCSYTISDLLNID